MIVYIYGLLRKEEIIYVGKSTTPKVRLSCHRITYNDDSLRIKILDTFEDREIFWVEKLKEEGYNLLNKEALKDNEDWMIGDIVDFSPKKNDYKILDTLTNTQYPSFYKVGKKYNLDAHQIKARLLKPEKYPNFSHYKIINN